MPNHTENLANDMDADMNTPQLGSLVQRELPRKRVRDCFSPRYGTYCTAPMISQRLSMPYFAIAAGSSSMIFLEA